MVITVKLQDGKFHVIADGNSITTFARKYEAVACAKQLEILRQIIGTEELRQVFKEVSGNELDKLC